MGRRLGIENKKAEKLGENLHFLGLAKNNKRVSFDSDDEDGDGDADNVAIAKRPRLQLVHSDQTIVNVPFSEDTYFGQREAPVAENSLLLQAGIARDFHFLSELSKVLDFETL